MKRMILVAAALVACGLGTDANAQAPAGDKAAELKLFQQQLNWPFAFAGRDMPDHFGGYHPNYKLYCTTCYGGGSCGKDDTCFRCGPCAGDICERKKVETCHKCGIVGRVLFYECKRLGCGETGGAGCERRGCPMTITNCRGERKLRPEGFARYLTGEGESVFWLGGGPNYIPRFNCYGWGRNMEGPRSWYGPCCGCYESYLYGHFDNRGPLNLDPKVSSRCREEDAIPSDFENRRTRASNCPNGDCNKDGVRDADAAPTLKSPMGPGI